MICDAALPLLYDLVDGDIGRDEAVDVALHLGSCPGCAARLGEIRAAEALYAAAVSVPPPPELNRRIAGALALAAAAAGERPMPRSSPNRAAGIAAVAAAVCAAAAVSTGGLPASVLQLLERAGGGAAQVLASLHPPEAAAMADAWARLATQLAVPAVLGGGLLLAAALVAVQIGGSALVLLGHQREKREKRESER